MQEGRETGEGSGISFVEALDDMILVNAKASSWIDAVKLAGELLVKGGKVRRSYIDAMVKTTRELGPYSVIAPGVAIPHARPEDGAVDIGFSMVVLSEPVRFGSPNDPVYIVIGFSAVDKKSHLEALKQLADLLSKEGFIDDVKNARSIEEVKSIIARYMR